MRYFKFCHHNAVEKVAGGSFRFGSLAWYRHLEDDEDDIVAGDSFEGRDRLHIDAMRIPGRETAADRAALAALGINVSNVSDLTLNNLTREDNCGHWLVLCLSKAATPESLVTTYDSCVEIMNLSEFTDCMKRTGKIDNLPLCSVFAHGEDKDVTYVPRSRDPRADRAALNASPFKKRTRYAGQDEYRIALQPNDRYFPDIGYIQIAPPAGLLRIVTHGNTPLPVVENLTRPQIAAELVKVLGLVEQYVLVTDDLVANASETAELKMPGDRQFRIDQENAVRKRRQTRYENGLCKRIGKAYWQGRILPLRGNWDNEFELSQRDAGRVGSPIAQLAEALDPGCVPEAYHYYLQRS